MKWRVLLMTSLAITVWSIWSLGHQEAPSLLLRLLAAGAGVTTLPALKRCLRQVPPRDSYGSAGFAEAKQIADLLIPENAPLGPGAFQLGRHAAGRVALSRTLALQHGVIVGGSGSGKSFSFFLPNTALARETSYVVTDPKSELWSYASGYHRATRYAPTEPEASAHFNWIPLCKDARLAELCARAVVEAGATERQEAPWPDLESAFLAALFSHTSTLSMPTPLTAYRLLTRSEPQKLMEMFLTSSSSAAREQAIIFQQTHERMRGSITPVLAAKLQWLRDPAIQRFCSASCAAPDFGKLRQAPEALFWCVREADLSRLRPLSSLFFTLLLEQLAAEAPLASGQETPVMLLLDEFANLGLIPHFDTTISLARGRGVSIWLGLQSLSQLEARYGRANAQTILTNCATKIAMPGLDVQTAEYFSRTLGQMTRVQPRRTWQKRRFAFFSLHTSETLQESPRPLLTPDEVRRMAQEQVLVITGNRRPLLLTRYRYNLPHRTAPTTALGAALSLPIEVVASPIPLLPPPPVTTKAALPLFPPELEPMPRKKPSPRKRKRAHITVVAR